MSFGLARGRTDLLFCQVDWHSVERHVRDTVTKEIDEYDGDRLLNTSSDDLCSYFVKKHEVVVPILNEEGIIADQKETKIDISQDPMRFIRDRSRPYYISGTCVEIEIPFSGDEAVFQIQPTEFSLNPPRGEIRQHKLILRIQGENLEPDKVKNDLDNRIREVREYLDRLRNNASGLNNSLPQLVQENIERRRKKLLGDRNLVSSLGFPLRPREGAAHTYVAPEIRKTVVPVPPKSSSAPFKPEPVLSDGDYENILSIMERMVSVMECSPHDFSRMAEETLRSHFLVQLNAQYVGQATGETFNYEGKTDILVKSGSRNIFVGECKFWGGRKKYGETIDQLLGYLSWRDTKSAIIIFNRKKDFSRVLSEIQEATLAHQNCKKFLRTRSETSWMYRFSHRDDPNREMTITVMAFDIPSEIDVSD